MGPDSEASRLPNAQQIKNKTKNVLRKENGARVMSEAISTTVNVELRMRRNFYRVIVLYRCGLTKN